MKNHKQTVYKLFILIIGLTIIYSLLNRGCDKIPEIPVKVDTIYISTHSTDTVRYAVLDTLYQTRIKVVREPDTVRQLDTFFVFDEVRTYSDSIIDTFWRFVYSMDIIGQPLSFNYDMNVNYPVVTKTIRSNNSFSLYGLVGNSFQIQAILKKPRLDYTVACQPFDKIYLVGIGFTLKEW